MAGAAPRCPVPMMKEILLLWHSNMKSPSALLFFPPTPAAGSANLISWNDHEPKYDIRDWSPDGSKMGKGISMTKEDLIALKGILDDMEL